MSVNATCGKCDAKLSNDTLEIENGLVQISNVQMDMEKLNAFILWTRHDMHFIEF